MKVKNEITGWQITAKGTRESVLKSIEESKAPAEIKTALKAEIPQCQACEINAHGFRSKESVTLDIHIKPLF